MSARSIRRAAERQAQKLARKAGIADAPVVSQPSLAAAAAPAPEIAPQPLPQPISDARLAANRENAKKSSGPTTLEGKAISSLNAIKTGLTGRTVLLPSDDAAEYQRHTDAYQESYQPVDKEERDLVLEISDATWRLQRIRSLELAIYAKGRVEFAAMFPEAEPGLRVSLIELHTFETYEKKLRNLSLQEARISRQRAKQVADIRLRQQQRKQQQLAEIKRATAAYEHAARDGRPVDPNEPGFEFSIAEIDALIARRASQPDAKFQSEPEA